MPTKILGMSELDTAPTDDWSAKATSTIVGYVDTVRSATTGRALLVSRLAVYFVAAGLVAIVAFVLLLVTMVRALVLATNKAPFFRDYVSDGEVWMAYLIMAIVFLLLGWFMWRKRGR